MGKLFKNNSILKLTSVESTNSYASELKSPLPEGSIIWALDQTSGRGQGPNKWESEANKNITCSIILNPIFIKANQQFYISKIIALAVADLVSLYTDKVAIKWPNDIYIKDKKIAGILIENSIEGNYIKQTIAGMGININQKKFVYAPNATSLALLTNEELKPEELLVMLTDLIEYRYSLLKENDFRTIDENYNQLLYRRNIKAMYSSEGKEFEGIILGVDTGGELRIQDNSGDVRIFMHKEVEFIF